MLRHMRALLWKEWRQTRALALALAIGCCVWVPAVQQLAAWFGERDSTTAEAAAAFILFAAVVVPAASIAGERGSRTLVFLLEAPIGRGRVFTAKVVASLAVWVALSAFAVGLGHLCGGFRAENFTNLRHLIPSGWEGPVGESWASSFPVLGILFFCSLLVSAGTSRPLLAIALCLPVAAALWAAALFAYPFHVAMEPPSWSWIGDGRLGEHLIPAVAPVLLAVVTVMPLGMAWFVFSRVREGSGSPAQRAWVFAKAFGQCALVFFLPHAFALGSVLLRQATAEPRDAAALLSGTLTASPDGRKVAFDALFPTVPFGPLTQRACVVDVATGSSRLLTRFRESRQYWLSSWSPCGRYLAYTVGGEWVAGVSASARRRSSFSDRQVVSFLDAETGERREAALSADHSPAFQGWWDDGAALIVSWPATGRGEMRGWLYRAGRGELEPFEPPPLGDGRGPVAPRLWRRGWAWHARERGDDKRDRLSVYDPAAKRWNSVLLPPKTWDFLLAPGGRQMGLAVHDEESQQRVRRIELWDLVSGARTILLEAPEPREALLEYWLSRGGGWVLLGTTLALPEGTSREFKLYHLPTGQWKNVPTVERPGDAWAGGEWELPEPGLAYVWQPRFIPDDSGLVWALNCWNLLAPPGRVSLFYVYDFASGRLRALPVAAAMARPGRVFSVQTVAEGRSIFFTFGEKAIYRIRLDGTGLERLFPEKKPLTPTEFEAEAGTR